MYIKAHFTYKDIAQLILFVTIHDQCFEKHVIFLIF